MIINNSPHTVTIILISEHHGAQKAREKKVVAYTNKKIRYKGLLNDISVWPKSDLTKSHLVLSKEHGIRQNTTLLLQKNDAPNDNPLRWSLNSRW